MYVLIAEIKFLNSIYYHHKSSSIFEIYSPLWSSGSSCGKSILIIMFSSIILDHERELSNVGVVFSCNNAFNPSVSPSVTSIVSHPAGALLHTTTMCIINDHYNGGFDMICAPVPSFSSPH